MRKTKIICTIGPASESEDKLKELMLAGMNVARFNFSHGTHEEQKKKLTSVIKVSNELGLPVATLLDTKGPEIRLKDFENGKAQLEAGQEFILTTEDILGTEKRASITYKNLKNDVKEGMTILIDDGKIEMVIEKITRILSVGLSMAEPYQITKESTHREQFYPCRISVKLIIRILSFVLKWDMIFWQHPLYAVKRIF